MNDIVEANKSAGGHFFDDKAMISFQTELHDELFPNAEDIFFITSEKYENEDRHYKVRVFSRKSASVWTPYREGVNMRRGTYAEAAELAQKLSTEE